MKKEVDSRIWTIWTYAMLITLLAIALFLLAIANGNIAQKICDEGFKGIKGTREVIHPVEEYIECRIIENTQSATRKFHAVEYTVG